MLKHQEERSKLDFAENLAQFLISFKKLEGLVASMPEAVSKEKRVVRRHGEISAGNMSDSIPLDIVKGDISIDGEAYSKETMEYETGFFSYITKKEDDSK